MAAPKKTVTAGTVKATAAKIEEPKTAAKKAETSAAPVKTENVKETSIAEKSAKAEVKKEPVKKETAKKTPGRKPAAKKAELKSEICVQFSGKSYTQEDLVKIARDVWKYDLKQKVGELKKIELYVKPEEHMVYYVMNKDFAGSFSI